MIFCKVKYGELPIQLAMEWLYYLSMTIKSIVLWKIIFNPIERKEKIILAVGRLDILFESRLVLGEGNERTKLEQQIDKGCGKLL